MNTGYVDKSNGYKKLSVNGRATYAHRYVMEQHLGRKLARDEHVHHKDGNKLNNTISNLEVITASQHIILYGPKGSSTHWSKLKEADIPEIRKMRKKGMKHREIAAIYKVDESNIIHIINGKTWKHV